MYCNPVFIILIKYHRVKETQQISRGKCIIDQFIVVSFFAETVFSPNIFIYSWRHDPQYPKFCFI